MLTFQFCVILSVIGANAQSQCANDPIDLNTATISEIDTLPYVSTSSAELITNLRPICSPLELTKWPKKIRGLTTSRLNANWNWYEDQSCTDTCCKAIASCTVSPSPSTTTATYSWEYGSWSTCTAECDTGTQYRDVTCSNSTHIVNDALCLTLSDGKPTEKQVCNTQACPIYEWIASEWGLCTVNSTDSTRCSQSRNVSCYDTASNTQETADKCAAPEKLDGIQSCETCTKISSANAKSTQIDAQISVSIDFLHAYNQQQCNTESYTNIDDPTNMTLITRRACSIDIWVVIEGRTDSTAIDASWFYLEASLLANVDESVGSVWNDDYVSWRAHNTNSGWITVTFPSNGAVGKFLASLHYQHNGIASNRQKLADFTLFVLFNPYAASDDVYVSSITDRKEYVENPTGLIWQGVSDENTAFQWHFNQFHFPNLEISMNLLNRLALQYRNDLVLIARHISYAVGADICRGKWGDGSYTTGRPWGGYYCSKTKRSCRDPLSWRGTTELFDVYRDVLDSQYPVQYCQCFVYAGVVTTVGRALGIPTRPISNFQSAHDTDFNRGIEKYWMYNEDSKTYEISNGGASTDSIWSFHVWNEMYFKRSDFVDTATSYNVAGWQVVDATPQEYSFGGNPGLSDPTTGVYQMGPASLQLVKANINTNACLYAAANKQRFGCFDTEFVISEVNANYNFWWKKSTDPVDGKYTLWDSYAADPFGDNYGTIGQQISTKKPGSTISDKCLDEKNSDCSDELLDVTSLYKRTEPSRPSLPTNTTNYYTAGQQRNRRRLGGFRRRLQGINVGYNSSNSSLDFGGFEYNIDSVPKFWYLSSMIIADDAEEISYLYHDDYTFGMMSIQIDSYQDAVMSVYCGLTVTAHDYSGQLLTYLNRSIVKQNSTNFMIDAGESERCVFYVNYTEYAEWVNEREDVSQIPYSFKLVLSASILTDNATEPEQSIVEERDFLICSPIYRLRDRIICHNGLKWFEPSFHLDYECSVDENNGIDVNSVADGFCDAGNNVAGCYDGGDCCASSCIPSDDYFCEYFDCIDDRVNDRDMDYFQCREPLSFIEYMDRLINASICIDAEQSIWQQDFNCTDKIWSASTGNECVDYVSAINGVYGEIKSCFNETMNSIPTQMKEILYVVIDCMDAQERLDNGTYAPFTTSSTTNDKTDGATKSSFSLLILPVLYFWY